MDIIVTSDFQSLRLAYIEVKTFIEKEVGTEVNSLQTKIDEDLGCAGDDNYDLLVKFVVKYNLDYAEFDYAKHFLFEGELLHPLNYLLAVIYLPFAIVFWVIKKLTKGKLNLFKVIPFPSWQRPTLDLTFGDMLTWYLMGKYCLRADVRFDLQKTI